jgi:tRNA A-37 threonylcarbamoyl transferase component Bud32
VLDAPDGYENLARIDQGGSAIVYRALDTRFDRTVALKILRSDSLNERQLRRFNAECLATGRVSSHPNIVTVYDAGTTPGHRPWLAMEYCSGGSLAHRVARVGPLPVGEVISIGVRLCGALTAAHEAGILHRDVKPHNVLLTSYGEPALADFGIASVHAGEHATGSVATETGAYTVVHAAPEILEGRAGSPAADIYSLGSTLYTLLAGQAPFAREASTGLAPLVTCILRNDVPVIARPGVPPELEQLLRRSMAARPQDRPASAAELGASLAGLGRRLAARDPAVPPRPPARPTATSPISATRLLVILGCTLGVLLAGFMAWGSGFRSSEPGIPPGAARATVDMAASPGATSPGRAADKYAPKGLAVSQGDNQGELIVTWRMPIRPDVVATVIYQGAGTARARAIVNYNSAPQSAPQTTLHGLPGKQRVCVSAAHLVSIGDKVVSAVSRPVCAVPR